MSDKDGKATAGSDEEEEAGWCAEARTDVGGSSAEVRDK